MIDLQQFCGTTKYDWTNRPFAVGAHAYATDGKIIVRVPRSSVGEQLPEAPPSAPLAVWHSIDFKGDYVPPKDIKPVNGRVFIGCMVFYEDQWSLVAKLPGFEYNDTIAKNPEVPATPLSFRFEGGSGAIMPRSPLYDKGDVGHA